MNRTLKRPMFRMGGSSGTGITSGLDQQPRKPLQQGSMPNFQFGGVPGFLTSFGLNLLGTPPRGNIFQTAATAARDPFNRLQEFQTRRALTKAERDFDAKKRLEDREFKEQQQKDLIAAQQKMSEAEIEAKAAETDKLITSRENIAQMKLNEDKGVTVEELASVYLSDYDGDLNKATNKAKFFVEVRPELVKNYGETQIGGIIEVDLSNEKAAKSFAKQNRGKIGKVFYDINTGETKKLIKNPDGELGFISVSSTAIPDTEGDDLPDSTKSKLGFEQTEYQKKIAKQTEEGLKRRKEEKKRKVDESLIGTSFEDLSG